MERIFRTVKKPLDALRCHFWKATECQMRRRRAIPTTRVERWPALAVALSLFAAGGCASEPEPAPVVPGGGWVERRGAGVFQHLPEVPKPRRGEDDPAERAPAPSPYRRIQITTRANENIRGELVDLGGEEIQVLEHGTVRRVSKQDVRTIRLYPRGFRWPGEDERGPGDPAARAGTAGEPRPELGVRPKTLR